MGARLLGPCIAAVQAASTLGRSLGDILIHDIYERFQPSNADTAGPSSTRSCLVMDFSQSAKPRLCQVCLNTIFADESADKLDCISPHHRTRQSILEARDFGCYICRRGDLAADATSTYWRMSIAVEDGSFRVTIAATSPSRDPVELLNWNMCLNYHGFCLNPIATHDRSFELAHVSLLQSSTGHERVLDLAKYWLQECLEHHALCRKNLDSPMYPIRLLDISDSAVRLVECTDIKTTHPYATLSYCWGSQPFLTLTSANEAAFRQGLETNELPSVFRDVITAARHLEIKYVWIDCCCIKQNTDGTDSEWQTECAKMEQVGSGSKIEYTTIKVVN